jgi:hypothetical protein
VAETSPLAVWLWPDRHRIAGHLLAMHAISPGDAVAYTPQTAKAAAEFDRLRARGIVREAIRGHYWLDWAAFNAETDARRSRLSMIAGFGALAIAGALMLTMVLR